MAVSHTVQMSMRFCLYFRLDAKLWSTPQSVFSRCLTNSTAAHAVCAWILRQGRQALWGYLDRMGFFDHLSENVVVLPARPAVSGFEIYGGTNARLVKITRINRAYRDDRLPSLLTEAVMRSCGDRTDANELEGAAWTIFAELIDNIFSHSNTPLDGYAALQLYSQGNKLQVAVSDSGLRIMSTLRPALKHEFPVLDRLSDTELLVEIFRQGISRHGADRGCGLKGSAAKAMKYNADLDVRLPNIRVLLTLGKEGYRPKRAYCYDNLPLNGIAYLMEQNACTALPRTCAHV